MEKMGYHLDPIQLSDGSERSVLKLIVIILDREGLRTIKAALDRLEGVSIVDIYAESEE